MRNRRKANGFAYILSTKRCPKGCDPHRTRRFGKYSRVCKVVSSLEVLSFVSLMSAKSRVNAWWPRRELISATFESCSHIGSVGRGCRSGRRFRSRSSTRSCWSGISKGTHSRRISIEMFHICAKSSRSWALDACELWRHAFTGLSGSNLW